MADSRPSLPDPVPIGSVAEPAFARLPDASSLFALRAERYRSLAEGHPLAPYLWFLAALAQVQHGILADLPAPAMPNARQHGVPPLDRDCLASDGALREAIPLLAARCHALEMHDKAANGLARVADMGEALRNAIGRAIVTVPPRSTGPPSNAS